MKGGDIKDLGRRATGAFTADALEKRYKHEGTTVDVDKNFSFKNLVTETGGGGSFSLFGASACGRRRRREDRRRRRARGCSR